MHILLILLIAVALLYIFYLYQATYSENPCFAALFQSLFHRVMRGGHGDRLFRYQTKRNEILTREKMMHIGGTIELSEDEKNVNERIMKEKQYEHDQGMLNPKAFLPSRHFFSALEKINSSQLFQMIKTMPKGGILHTHDMAMLSAEAVVELSYRDNLWVLRPRGNDRMKFKALRFTREEPEYERGSWIPMKKLRDTEGAKKVDEAFVNQTMLYPREKYADQEEVWEHFLGVFMLLEGMLSYVPVWREYFTKALQEIYADGVQYLEFRTILPTVYDLDKEYTAIDAARIWYEEALKFKGSHEDFIGAKLIYAPLRSVPDATFDDYLRTCLELKKELPEFFAGFDLVSHEDNARALKEFAEQLLCMQPELNYFFHAGETNWFGTETDENLIDAVLFGTKRIGHGFALIKHPEVLRIVKQNDIAIEVCPISNQALLFISDFRNHPCATLFAENYPVVISSDDNSIFKSTPLSHDFYIAFLGIASRGAGLGMLKQLAWNSIKYSSLDEKQKDEAYEKFINRWNKWLAEVNAMPLIKRAVFQPKPKYSPKEEVNEATKREAREKSRPEVKEDTKPEVKEDLKPELKKDAEKVKAEEKHIEDSKPNAKKPKTETAARKSDEKRPIDVENSPAKEENKKAETTEEEENKDAVVVNSKKELNKDAEISPVAEVKKEPEISPSDGVTPKEVNSKAKENPT